MKINEIVSEKYDFRWDESRCGFATTVNGEEVAFYVAKSKWDRSGAQDQAKKHANRLRTDEINAEREQREHEYQFNKPLTQLEKEWIELDKRIIRFCRDKDQSAELSEKEFNRYRSLGEVVRKSISHGTHPAVSYRK